jgi:hypothetical protein
VDAEDSGWAVFPGLSPTSLYCNISPYNGRDGAVPHYKFSLGQLKTPLECSTLIVWTWRSAAPPFPLLTPWPSLGLVLCTICVSHRQRSEVRGE